MQLTSKFIGMYPSAKIDQKWGRGGEIIPIPPSNNWMRDLFPRYMHFLTYMSFFIVKNAAEIHVWLLEVIQIFDTSHVLPVVLYGVDLQFVGRALLSPY